METSQAESKNSYLKIRLAQLNLIVGDLDGNFQKILNEYNLANEARLDLVIFSEMAICGYPCEDLWLNPKFIKNCQRKILDLIKITKDKNCAILLGAPTLQIESKKKFFNEESEDEYQKFLYNSAILIEGGEAKNVIHKKTLPNYGVFDENRYFKPAKKISVIEFRGFDIAILICEDLWDEKNLYLLREQIIDMLIVINASPFEKNKLENRFKIAKNFVVNLNKPLIYLNQIGAQDSLVFDGSSFVLNIQGDEVLEMKSFDEDFSQITIDKKGLIEVQSNSVATAKFNKNNFIELAYNACVLGLRDYILKNNFKKVILGMSGGIDSALVATIAVDALGSDNIMLYALPTKFNSQSSFDDAKQCADNLGVELKVIEIENIFQNTLDNIQIHQSISPLAQENLQSRIRGNILMAISNTENALLISTGNKSEMACGYATLYGDMNGAFNPIKDFYKTEIYDLANFRNKNFCKISQFEKLNLIPKNIIKKAPTAELRYNQKDSDSLPEYEILDKILFEILEEKKSIEDIAKMGFEIEVVKKVAKLIHFSEYKRKQAVMGVKISNLSFDKDRRYPLTNMFHQ